MPTVLITGCNRGLGLEFTRQYLSDGWRVIATCRDASKADALSGLDGDLRVLSMAVDDDASIAQAAAELKGEAIDVLVCNAGVMGERASLGDLTSADWDVVLRVNIIAPLIVAQAFIENVAASDQKKIATVSSKMGSVADNDSGGQYIYRSSKAGVNAAMRSLAIDLAPRGISACVLHPGWVRTDMGGPNGLIDPPESVSGMRSVIASLDSGKAGGFWNYDGSEIPW